MALKIHLPQFNILSKGSHEYARCAAWTPKPQINETKFYEAPVEDRCKACHRIAGH